MRILYISGLDSQHSHRWIQSFHSKKNEIGWINLRNTKKTSNYNYKIKPKSSYSKFPFFNLVLTYFISLIQLMFWKPEVLHVHYMGLNGLLGLIIPAKKKIFTAWGSDVIFPKYTFLLKLMILRADLITTDAQHVYDKLVSIGAKKEKIKIINFGIETNKFIKKPKNSYFRNKLFNALNENDPIVLSLRNHEEIYDIETLINSITNVLSKINNVKFCIGGSGSLTEKYKKLVEKLNLQNNVSFFGSYDHNELSDLFGQVNLYVSTSLSDAGISSSTAEAMSCEVPVIISNTGENDIWIQDGINGDLFEAGDFEKLSSLIINNLDHIELAEAKGKKGRQTIIERNDLNNEMIKMKKIYGEVISSRNS